MKVYTPWLLQLRNKLGLAKDYRKNRYRLYAIDVGFSKKYNAKERYFENNRKEIFVDLQLQQLEQLIHKNISFRLESCYALAHANNVEYRYPFFDVKLLELYFSLPSSYKFNKGTGRFIFREAMKGILVEKVRMNNNKAGMIIPNVYYRFFKDLNQINELVEESRIFNRYHYVDYDKLVLMIEKIILKSKGQRVPIGIRAVYSTLSILLAQKWQREGKIDIGIKC
jgi:asparagine synthetase B (glutamine-hydrolysing)